MLTIIVTKEINGKVSRAATPPLDEDSITVSELNSEVQRAIGKILDRESSSLN